MMIYDGYKLGLFFCATALMMWPLFVSIYCLSQQLLNLGLSTVR